VRLEGFQRACQHVVQAWNRDRQEVDFVHPRAFRQRVSQPVLLCPLDFMPGFIDRQVQNPQAFRVRVRDRGRIRDIRTLGIAREIFLAVDMVPVLHVAAIDLAQLVVVYHVVHFYSRYRVHRVAPFPDPAAEVVVARVGARPEARIVRAPPAHVIAQPGAHHAHLRVIHRHRSSVFHGRHGHNRVACLARAGAIVREGDRATRQRRFEVQQGAQNAVTFENNIIVRQHHVFPGGTLCPVGERPDRAQQFAMLNQRYVGLRQTPGDCPVGAAPVHQNEVRRDPCGQAGARAGDHALEQRQAVECPGYDGDMGHILRHDFLRTILLIFVQ
jgi:hypothetical protein